MLIIKTGKKLLVHYQKFLLIYISTYNNNNVIIYLYTRYIILNLLNIFYTNEVYFYKLALQTTLLLKINNFIGINTFVRWDTKCKYINIYWLWVTINYCINLDQIYLDLFKIKLVYLSRIRGYYKNIKYINLNLRSYNIFLKEN